MSDDSNKMEQQSAVNSQPVERSAARMARRSALLLGMFALITTALLAVAESALSGRISQNAEAALLETLNAIVPANRYDNNLAQSKITLPADPRLGLSQPTEAFVATRSNRIVAFVMPITAAKGYSGPIQLLAGIYTDGTVAGVRVLEHKETPGLGDKIERRKSAWITGFDGRSLGQPDVDSWKVQKDGGKFDQLTGATITPRAVVNAVREALQFYAAEKTVLGDQYRERQTVQRTEAE